MTVLAPLAGSAGAPPWVLVLLTAQLRPDCMNRDTWSESKRRDLSKTCAFRWSGEGICRPKAQSEPVSAMIWAQSNYRPAAWLRQNQNRGPSTKL